MPDNLCTDFFNYRCMYIWLTVVGIDQEYGECDALLQVSDDDDPTLVKVNWKADDESEMVAPSRRLWFHHRRTVMQLLFPAYWFYHFHVMNVSSLWHSDCSDHAWVICALQNWSACQYHLEQANFVCAKEWLWDWASPPRSNLFVLSEWALLSFPKYVCSLLNFGSNLKYYPWK